MICSKCGTNNPDYYVFCQNCFADLTEIEAPHPEYAASDDANAAPSGMDEPEAAAPPFLENEKIPADDVSADPWEMLKTPPQPPRVHSGKPMGNPDEPYLRQPGYGSTKREREPVQAPAYNAAKQREARKDSRPRTASSAKGNAREQGNRFDGYDPAHRVPAAKENAREQEDRFNAYDAPHHNTQPQSYVPYASDEADISPVSYQQDEKQLSARELKKMKKEAEREAKELKKLQESQGAEYYDYYDYYDETALKREKRRTRLVSVIFWLVLIVLVGAAASLAYIYATDHYGSLQNAFSAIIGGNQPVTVEPVTDSSGAPAHKIRIPAKEGDTLDLRDEQVNQQRVVSNTGITDLTIQDSVWIPAEPDETAATLEITPNIVLISTSGEETVLNIPTFSIDVPQTTLTLTEPAQTTGISIEGNLLTISGQAGSPTGDVHIFVNGQNLGTNVDEAGNFSADVPVDPGEFSIQIKAVAVRNRSTTITVSGTSNAAAAAGVFAFTDSFAKPVEQESIQVSGTTKAGSVMSVEGGASDIQYDPNTGTFSFTASLPLLGFNHFTLKLSDGTSETLSIARVPDVTQFTSSAKPLTDYADVHANPSDNKGISYYFDGTVLASEQLNKVQQVTIALNGDESKQIDLTYFGLTTPVIGATYRVYGVGDGNTQEGSAIKMQAYFMYDEEAMAQMEAQSAEAATSSPAAG